MTDGGAGEDEGIDGGWVLLSSGIIDSAVFNEGGTMFRLWILLLCSVHRHHQPLRLFNGVEIKRGEMVTSLGRLASRLWQVGVTQAGEPERVTVSRWTVGRLLDALARERMIERVSTPHRGTWIRVVNFEKYQAFDQYRIARTNSQAHTTAQNQCSDMIEETCTDIDASAQSSAHPCSKPAPNPHINDSGSPKDPKEETEDARARDYTIMHPAIEPEPMDNPPVGPDLGWIVRQSFIAQYTEKYTHPPTWDEHKDTLRAKAMVGYLQSVADAWGRGQLDATAIEKATKRMTIAYLKDKDRFVVERQHPFWLFRKQAHMYVQKKVKP